MAMFSKIRTSGLAFLVVAISGCGWPEPPAVVTISDPPVFRPVSPKEIETVDQTMAAVITVCNRDLALPSVDPLYVHVYRNVTSLAFYGIGWRTLSLDVANIDGFAIENKMHINLDKVSKASWGARLPLFAHEYAHNIEFQVTGGNLRSTIWFSEGFGDWVTARVLDSLAWQSYEVTLHRAKLELDRHREVVQGLSWLQDKRDWDSQLQKPKGYVRTYSLAFAAVARLVEKKGISSAIGYIKSGDFEGSFGESQVAYKTDLGNRKQLQTNTFAIGRPEWKVGYHWTYEEKLPGAKQTLRKEIANESYIRNMPVFVVTLNGDEELYAKETLGLIATKKNGQLRTERDKSNEFFNWPLVTAKEWRNAYSIQDFVNRDSGSIDRWMVIADMEEVRVPAGTFKAVKIEAYDNKSGRLDAEYWYSPTARWFVKIRNYGLADGFVREQQLLNLKLD
jgi:hypothetical protein